MARMLKLAILPVALLFGTAVAASAAEERVTITTAAGTGAPQVLEDPRDALVLANGDLLVAEFKHDRVRRFPPTGAGSVVAGTAGITASSIAVSADERYLFVADRENNRIKRIDLRSSTGAPTTVLSSWTVEGGDDDKATYTLDKPEDVAVTPDGDLLVADTQNDRVVVKAAAGGTPRRILGIEKPHDLALTSDGFLVVEPTRKRVSKVRGSVGGSWAPRADVVTGLEHPTGVAWDGARLLVADAGAHRVWSVADGAVTAFAGSGTRGFAGDGSLAAQARLDAPEDARFGPGGQVVVADTKNHRVRRVTRTIVADPTPTPTPDPAPGPEPVPAPTPETPETPEAPAPAPAPGPAPPAAPAPQAGKTVVTAPVRGTVRVKLPGKDDYVALDGATSVPTGAVLDTRKGAVALTAAQDTAGRTATATFDGGTFKVSQNRGPRPVTELRLQGSSFAACRASGSRAQASRRPRRRVWGSGHGRFRTRGRDGAATVRGTVWLTEDTCAGTRVRVRRGVVDVRDFGRGRTVKVRAGRSYLARHRAR